MSEPNDAQKKDTSDTALFFNRTVKRRVAKWLYGLTSGFIGGGAGAAGAAIGACVLKPEAFNVNAQLGSTLKLAFGVFLITGLTHALAFLQQSPLPPQSGDTQAVERKPQ